MPDRKPKKSAAQNTTPTKTCAACGRTVTWRKRWANNWDEVKFCSDACRSAGVHDIDKRLEHEILRLLHERGRDKTICPSEAARAVAATEDRQLWEPLMNPARNAARRLVAQGAVVITQKGVIVDASTAKGPIRLRLR